MSYPSYAELTAWHADQARTQAVALFETAQRTATLIPECQIGQLIARASALEELAWQLQLNQAQR